MQNKALNVNLKNNFYINSKQVKKNSVFFAIEGTKQLGSKYIHEAIKKGARQIVAEKKFKGNNFINVKDVRGYLAEHCARKYSNKPKNILAVTGTNGKSSVCNFYYQILLNLNIPVATIGTLGCFYKRNFKKLSLTTPDTITIHKTLEFLKKKKINNIILEASSHGLHQKRLNNINFNGAAFTNFTQDHLDYHRNLKNYLNAKLYLFNSLLKKNSYAILDTDIPQYQKILSICKKKKIKVYSFGKKGNTIKLISKKIKDGKQIIKINLKNKIYIFSTFLIGDFQIKNLFFSVIFSGLSTNKWDEIIHKLKFIKSTKGRMEVIGYKKNSPVIIDYAHTPDALKNALVSVKKHFKLPITLIFGCGGERDKKKRIQMGKIANTLAKKILLTNDNPRSEDPRKIVRQIRQGCKQAKIIYDRKKAIEKGIKELKANSVLLIAGKGHEDIQVFKNKTIPFSDHKISKLLLQRYV